MRPTEVLMQEHRVIEQVLDCLDAMARNADAGQPLDREDASQVIDFFSNFADRCHHGKEENCLFPMLEKKGFSPEQGPTAVMVSEHETGRKHVRSMSEAIEAAAAGDAAATNVFVSHACAFVTLLREHIKKEDHCLFQMADQSLTEQEQAQVMDSFNKVEHDDMGPGTHEKYLDIAAKLAKKYGVQCQATDLALGSSCCGHH
jgi:hemerythrin-like domain-containing protein